MEFLDQLFVKLNAWFAGLLNQFLPGWLADLIIMVIVATVLVLFAVVTMMYLTYLERKIVARIQDRLGPNRVGPLGLMQPMADAIKMLTKEDITPRAAHRVVYNLGPILIVPPALLVWAVIPFGRGMVGTDLDIGFLYVIAISATTTIAIFMAGWGSRNKYALLGAMRAVAQIVSYEVPQILSVVGVLMLAGSLSLVTIVEKQSSLWFFLLQPVGFLIFLISSIAEVNRTPFDLPEAESEIIAGYHTEYSGMKFAMFFIAEYVNTFLIAAVGTTLFLGGWQGPILPGWLWFFIKSYLIVFVIMWIRGTLPRIRVDQLMNFAWKFLVPLALVNLLVAAVGVSLTQGMSTWVTLITFIALNLLLVTGVLVVLTLKSPEAQEVALRGEGEAVRS